MTRFGTSPSPVMSITLMTVMVVMSLLMAMIGNTSGHLCLINVKQRGVKADYQKAGSPTCFQYKAPCGSAAPDVPALIQGGDLQLRFQQNFNHYSIGFPGYLEVSYSFKSDPQEDSDFIVLRKVTDYYPFRQWTQTNFTVSVNIPNQECDHCVLRVRYVPHKPSEPIFHQCSDVKVRRTGALPKFSKYSSGVLYSLSYDPSMDSNAKLLVIDPKTQSINDTINLQGFIIRGVKPVQAEPNEMTSLQGTSARPQTYRIHSNTIHNRQVLSSFLPSIMNSIVTIDPNSHTLFYMAYTGDNDDAFPDKVLYFIPESVPKYKIIHLRDLKGPIVSLNYENNKDSLLAIVSITLDDRSTQFTVYRISIQSGQMQYIAALKADNHYVNFLWSTYDFDRDLLHILIRHEDEPLKLTQKLYTVDVSAASVTYTVDLNSTQYAFSGLHYSSISRSLISLSPGPSESAPFTTPTWYTVGISPQTGEIKELSNLGTHDFYLGGYIFNGISALDKNIYHFYGKPERGLELVGVPLPDGSSSSSSKKVIVPLQKNAIFKNIYNHILAPAV